MKWKIQWKGDVMTGAKLRERERSGSTTLLALKVEEGTVHQEMEAEG